MKINVDKLSLRELDLLVVRAERQKQFLLKRRPAAVVRRKLISLAVSYGYAIEELVDIGSAHVVGKPEKRRKRVRLAAKYRDPENKRHTWSGRGRMPRWLSDRTKRGQSVTDFLIPGLARPTAKKDGRVGQRSVYKQN